MTFNEIYEKFPWREIYGCPGRFILKKGYNLSINEIVGKEIESRLYVSEKSKDPFYVCVFPDGGLISYQKEDNFLVHTLNTTEGLVRKLKDLGISG